MVRKKKNNQYTNEKKETNMEMRRFKKAQSEILNHEFVPYLIKWKELFRIKNDLFR
jgi:hypothetical protein